MTHAKDLKKDKKDLEKQMEKEMKKIPSMMQAFYEKTGFDISYTNITFSEKTVHVKIKLDI